jgi:hypothetical protein
MLLAITMYLIIKIILLCISIGIGFLLHWIMPSIDLGIGILIGVISTGISAYTFVKITEATESYLNEEEEAETPRLRIYPIEPFVGTRRKRRKAPKMIK